MNIWKTFTTALSPWVTKGVGNPDWSVLERYLGWAFGGGASASGIIVNPQTAMQSAAVYSCVKVLSESIGVLPFSVLSEAGNGDVAPFRQHPLWELLRHQPNEYQSAVDFWEMVVVHLCLRGNAYAYILRAKSGRVVELIPLHPDMVNVTMNAQNRVEYRAGLESGGMRLLDRGEILHIKGMSLNGWLGLSPIAYARESIGLALASEKFGGQLFSNGAKMGGVLEVPGALSDVAYARLKGSFDSSSSGENAHRTALLEEGAKFSKVSMNAEEAQFLETRKYQRSEIAGLFRVPPHKIGDLERATFGNIEEQNIQFVTDGVQPLATRIEQAVRRDLLSTNERSSMCVRFDMSALLRGNAKSRAEYYASGIVNGWLVRNEARRHEGLNRIEGLDVPLIPLNMSDGRDDPDEAADEAEGATQENDKEEAP